MIIPTISKGRLLDFVEKKYTTAILWNDIYVSALPKATSAPVKRTMFNCKVQIIIGFDRIL